MFGTYQRLGVSVWASDMDVIRAARKILKKSIRKSRKWRTKRHEFYRIMLNTHYAARHLAVSVLKGVV